MAMYGAPIGGAWGGLFSDLVRVPYADAVLVPLPPGLDPVAMASAGDNWPLSWHLVAPHLEARPGARVLVVARGGIGLYVCDDVRAHIPDALALAASGKVAPDRVVSAALDWEQLPDALPEKHLEPVFVRDLPPSSPRG